MKTILLIAAILQCGCFKVDYRTSQSLERRGLIYAKALPGYTIWECLLTDAGKAALKEIGE